MASHQELLRRLAKLDADIPEMKRLYPNRGDFISEFNGHADHITDEAGAADVDWAFEQVDLLLEKHGFIADSGEGQTHERTHNLHP